MKIFNNLLVRVICGILLGILLGIYAPEWLYRILLTFQSLFSNFLKFAIPLIMMGLIMPSIADLGKNAGKLLLITVGIAYVFTLFSGFSTYLVGEAIFPSLLQGEQLASLAENSVKSAPYFTIEMPPLADVMSALVLSFIIGIGLSFREETKLTDVIREFGDIIKWLIIKAIIPILPFYILCIFAEITYSGQVVAIMEVFFKLIVILFVMHICLLIIQYLIAGGISGKNPFKALGTMLPAYATALGTQSSAATIPVTLRQSLKLGISQRRLCNSALRYHSPIGEYNENHRLRPCPNDDPRGTLRFFSLCRLYTDVERGDDRCPWCSWRCHNGDLGSTEHYPRF